MSVMFLIIVFIALNVVPPGVEEFQIVDPAGRTVNGQPVEKVVEFTRQPNGTWRVVDLPRDQFGTYAFDGKTLTVSPPEDKQKRGKAEQMVFGMTKCLNVVEGLDWATVKEITTEAGGKVVLSRKADQITADIAVKRGDEVMKQTFHIRWKAKKTE